MGVRTPSPGPRFIPGTPWNFGFLSAVVCPLTSSIFAPNSGTPSLTKRSRISELRTSCCTVLADPLLSVNSVSPSLQGGWGVGCPRGTAVGERRLCPRLWPAGGSRGQQRAARRGEERRWRATAGRDFKSPSFPPNPSFSSPPPGRRGGSFYRPPRALARPCSVSGDRQQPASKSLIIFFFFSSASSSFSVEAEKSEAGASAAPGLLGPWAWRGGAGGWRPHGARPHLPPGLGSMK